jgi:hypothetical protein
VLTRDFDCVLTRDFGCVLTRDFGCVLARDFEERDSAADVEPRNGRVNCRRSTVATAALPFFFEAFDVGSARPRPFAFAAGRLARVFSARVFSALLVGLRASVFSALRASPFTCAWPDFFAGRPTLFDVFVRLEFDWTFACDLASGRGARAVVLERGRREEREREVMIHRRRTFGGRKQKWQRVPASSRKCL